MKHCSITDLSEQPTAASLLANQHLLKRYFDTTGECDHFEHASVKLYTNEEDAPEAMKLNFGIKAAHTDSDFISYPLIYQRKRIGDLQLAGKAKGQNAYQLMAEQNASKVARKIALLVKRDQANTLSGLYLGKSLSLEGYSETVFNLEAFIEKAAGTQAPVVIEGDFGSEKLAVASSIHYNSQVKHRPFIEIICSQSQTDDFREKLINCFNQAKGGSIYLHGVDELSAVQQDLLLELLAASSEHNPKLWPQINTADVRLLLSTSRCLDEMVKQGSFSRQLHAQVEVLKVKIPSLNERKEDLAAIIEQQVKRHRLYQEQSLSPEVEKALCNFHWPENYQQLERTVARLLAMSNNNPVELAELRQHAPEILTQPSRGAAKEAAVQQPDLSRQLVPNLMAGNYEIFGHLHAGLQKALKYMGEHYCREITLTELAQNAYVSPSHLSYLLKFYLGHSFKQILAELRIERAKQLFDAAPNSRITDVSLDVGFGDLSHFEKIFKRHTGVTPRQYKNGCRMKA